jgi:hypothetical protein
MRRRSNTIAAKSDPDFGRLWNLRSSSRFIRVEIVFSIIEPTEFVDRVWMLSTLQGRNPRLDFLRLNTAQAVFEHTLCRAQSAGLWRLRIHHYFENGRSGCA